VVVRVSAPEDEPTVAWRDADGHPIGHFLAIDDVPYEGTNVLGAYSTFEEARTDLEARTKAHAETQYSHDYGVDRATIQPWRKDSRVAEWERDPSKPLDWVKTL
jgi:hypothetical protein